MKAWYFAAEDKKLRHRDNREIHIGETHEVTGDIKLCNNGLHASIDILDALNYAPGPVIYRVELSGKMDKGCDKVAAQKRTYISGGIDISDVLLKFARMCALDVIHLWDAPEVVVRYLKTGDESLRPAAWASASYAAGASASYAAGASASYAAGDAARPAARDAAWASASYAAGASAWASARDAASKKQSKRLERMVRKAIKEKK